MFVESPARAVPVMDEDRSFAETSTVRGDPRSVLLYDGGNGVALKFTFPRAMTTNKQRSFRLDGVVDSYLSGGRDAALLWACQRGAIATDLIHDMVCRSGYTREAALYEIATRMHT